MGWSLDQVTASALPPACQSRPRWLTSGPGTPKRPRTVRRLRQVTAAAVLQADLEQPAALDAARSDRLLDPAPLDPDHGLTPAQQHRPRGLVAPATGIAAHLDQITHTATSRVHSTSQARWAIACHGRYKGQVSTE